MSGARATIPARKIDNPIAREISEGLREARASLAAGNREEAREYLVGAISNLVVARFSGTIPDAYERFGEPAQLSIEFGFDSKVTVEAFADAEKTARDHKDYKLAAKISGLVVFESFDPTSGFKPELKEELAFKGTTADNTVTNVRDGLLRRTKEARELDEAHQRYEEEKAKRAAEEEKAKKRKRKWGIFGHSQN